VLSEKRQELRSAFVGVELPCTVESRDIAELCLAFEVQRRLM
jgi:hypothetical protein